MLHRDDLNRDRVSLKVGEEHNITALTKQLVGMGYDRELMVEERGHLSVRGGIFDVFPISAELPFRIEFYGDEIESIREQLSDTASRGREHPDADQIREAARVLDERLLAIEMKLSDQRLSGGSARQDLIRWPRQRLSKLSSLAGYVGQTDFPNGDLANFNRTLAERGLAGVVVRP